MREIWAKDSPQSDLQISGYKRNGEGAESENAEIGRDRETDPISERLSPHPRHGSQGPEGKPFSHLGRRSRMKNMRRRAKNKRRKSVLITRAHLLMRVTLQLIHYLNSLRAYPRMIAMMTVLIPLILLKYPFLMMLAMLVSKMPIWIILMRWTFYSSLC